MRAWFAAGLLLAAPAPTPATACEWRAELPIRIQDGFPFVSATVGVRAITLLLDTGAQGHLVVPEAVARLGLVIDPSRTAPVLGTGGAQTVPTTMLRGLRLSTVALPDTRAPVLALPGVPGTLPPLAGLLGAPLLEQYDVEIDGPRRRMTLWTEGCIPAGAETLVLTPENEVLLPVQANGVRLLALLDTGSRSTLLSDRAAAVLELTGDVAASTARGLDGKPMQLRFLRLRRLRIGAETATDVPVSATALQSGRADLLIGWDFLSRRRTWISFRTKQALVVAK